MQGIAINYLPLGLWRLWFALMVAVISLPANADVIEERLVNVGIKIFPAVMAAVQVTGEHAGKLTIEIVYLDNERYAEKLAERLQSIGEIKGRELEVKSVSVKTLVNRKSPPPSALFVSQRMDKQIGQVIDYANAQNLLTFSPFRSDVEAGVLSGIIVSDRVLPYINLQTLSGMPFELKPFFLKVAETYAP